MSKHSAIIGLGILVAVMPFLGFPPAFKDIFYTLAGLAISVVAYFTNIQYCNNCHKLIENGKKSSSISQQGVAGGEVVKKDITGLST